MIKNNVARQGLSVALLCNDARKNAIAMLPFIHEIKNGDPATRYATIKNINIKSSKFMGRGPSFLL